DGRACVRARARPPRPCFRFGPVFLVAVLRAVFFAAAFLAALFLDAGTLVAGRGGRGGRGGMGGAGVATLIHENVRDPPVPASTGRTAAARPRPVWRSATPAGPPGPPRPPGRGPHAPPATLP